MEGEGEAQKHIDRAFPILIELFDIDGYTVMVIFA